MNIAEYTTRIIVSLIWPLTVLTLAYSFKSEITKLLSRISKLKVSSVEADLVEELSSSNIPNISNKELESALPALVDIAKVSPVASVMYAWRLLDQELRDAYRITKTWGEVEEFEFYGSNYLSFPYSDGYLSKDEMEGIERLRKIRDEVIEIREEAPITFKTAKEYANQCAFYIKVAKRMQKKKKIHSE